MPPPSLPSNISYESSRPSVLALREAATRNAAARAARSAAAASNAALQKKSIFELVRTRTPDASKIAVRKLTNENKDSVDLNEFPIICVAAIFNDIAVLQKLIDLNADLDQKDKYGDTALTYACETKNAAAALLLVNAGANITIKSSDGQTALDIAKRKFEEDKSNPLMDELVKLLTERKNNAVAGGRRTRRRRSKRRITRRR
jgi:ankyrin repeat protein